MLFYFDLETVPEDLSSTCTETKKGKEKVVEGLPSSNLENSQAGNVPLVLFLKLLNRPLFLRSVVHLEQVWLIEKRIAWVDGLNLNLFLGHNDA